MQPETRDDHVRTIRTAFMRLYEQDSWESVTVEAGQKALDALVVEVERLTAALAEVGKAVEEWRADGKRVADELKEWLTKPGPGVDLLYRAIHLLEPKHTAYTDPFRVALEAGKSNPGDGEEAVDVEDIRMEAVSNALDALFPGIDADGYDLDEITSVGVGVANQLRDAVRAAIGVLDDHDCAHGYADEGDDSVCDECDALEALRDALMISAAGDERRHPDPVSPQNENPGDSTAVRSGGGPHVCAWCPVEVRDLVALAANASRAYGTEREAKKMAHLKHGVEGYQAALDAHFENSGRN